MGPHTVGFRTAFATDYSRRYGAQTGRPIFVSSWYPARVLGDSSTLCYGDYLAVTAETEAYAAFAERLTAYNREATIQYGLEQGASLLAQRELLPMRAFRNAEPVAGSFPVVVYHPGLGGSYEENSILCEYLASFGYIVVSSTFQPEEASSLNLDWDLTRSFHDLGFLLNTMIPCWFAATGPLQHNDFTSQGILDTIERHPDHTEATRIRQRYNAICDLTHHFLDHTLKGQPEPTCADEQLIALIHRQERQVHSAA